MRTAWAETLTLNIDTSEYSVLDISKYSVLEHGDCLQILIGDIGMSVNVLKNLWAFGQSPLSSQNPRYPPRKL